MQIKPLIMGNQSIENNVFLAPMAGYTDFAFRTVALKLGYGLTFTELVSAKGLVYKGQGSVDLLKSDNKNKTSVQLFGCEPEFIKAACESEELKDFKFVDINMGCPVPKVFKNGEGSALLTDIIKAEKVVKAAVSSGKTISVKIRTGQKYGDDVATEFTKMAENSGASLVTIHARVREAYYSGEPDYNAVEKAKKAVKIPVIANGGIKSVKDANLMIDKTGADGVMLARGAIENPLLVCEILGKKSPLTLKEFIFSQLDLLSTQEGEERSAVLFRKFISYYLKGLAGIKEFKLKLCTATNVQEIKDILSNIF